MNKRQLFDEQFVNPDRGFGSIASQRQVDQRSGVA